MLDLVGNTIFDLLCLIRVQPNECVRLAGAALTALGPICLAAVNIVKIRSTERILDRSTQSAERRHRRELDTLKDLAEQGQDVRVLTAIRQPYALPPPYHEGDEKNANSNKPP